MVMRGALLYARLCDVLKHWFQQFSKDSPFVTYKALQLPTAPVCHILGMLACLPAGLPACLLLAGWLTGSQAGSLAGLFTRPAELLSCSASIEVHLSTAFIPVPIPQHTAGFIPAVCVAAHCFR